MSVSAHQLNDKFAVLIAGHAPEYIEKTYGGYGIMLKQLLSDPGETWDMYAVVDGIFPQESDLENYKGFVISGSKHDAHGDAEWILKLCNLLQRLHRDQKRILGVCFGHQVLILPPEGVLLGSSQRTPIELFAVGNHVLGIQGHPDFNNDVILHIVDNLLVAGGLTEQEAKATEQTLKSEKDDKEIIQKLCKAFLKYSLKSTL